MTKTSDLASEIASARILTRFRPVNLISIWDRHVDITYSAIAGQPSDFRILIEELEPEIDP